MRGQFKYFTVGGGAGRHYVGVLPGCWEAQKCGNVPQYIHPHTQKHNKFTKLVKKNIREIKTDFLNLCGKKINLVGGWVANERNVKNDQSYIYINLNTGLLALAFWS